MPAKSEAQWRLMAMAEHNPGAVSKANRGVLDMSKRQLHDFAATSGLRKAADGHRNVKNRDRHGEKMEGC